MPTNKNIPKPVPGKDLSTKRATHMSTPLDTGDIEFHLEHRQVRAPKDFKSGGQYWVRFPVKGSSLDGKGHRYQVEEGGLPEVLPRAIPPARGPRTPTAKGATRVEQMKRSYNV